MQKRETKHDEYTKRPPIVTIMGHVDHGKTSILDKIRHSNITAKEYGGITQHIGAYQITHKNERITFIDTPGHAAFSQMRARGGRTADIVILVVAADEGVKPQTKEAIKHAKAANVEMLVAINKMDMPGADPQKVKQELAIENVLVEDWGGNILSIPVSAKTGEGIDNLLDAILAVAELMELKADAEQEVEAAIVESKKEKQRGVVVSAIIKNGSLHVGQEISASGFNCKVKSLMNDKGQMLKNAGPGDPVEILGFSEVPNVGDLIVEKGSELAALAIDENRIEIIGAETKKTVGLILKSDTQGTLEAIKAALASIVTESVGADFSIKFMRSATGDITDSDILLANSTNSLVIGFNVKTHPSIRDLAEDHGIKVKTFKTIYELIDDVKDMLEGTATKEESKIKGRAKVLKTFKLPSGDIIAGCTVIAGRIKENDLINIYLKDPADITVDESPIYVGRIKKIKQEKNEITEAKKNTECGLLFKPQYDDIAKDMWIEVR